MTELSETLRSDYEESRVFVTGASGFVGAYLIDHLIGLGAHVYGLDRRKSRGTDIARRVMGSGSDQLRFVTGDLTDISSLASAIDQSEPDYVFHLGAQSFVPESFINPIVTLDVNAMGTANLLEAIRQKAVSPTVVFAGSSEEYGLVFFSEKQCQQVTKKYGEVFPPPTTIPEVPIQETNPLRPISPYAVSKVASDHLMRNYHVTYGLRTVVSRAFNHEGAGRGDQFVTSSITKQVVSILYNETRVIRIGDVTSFRDWSHVLDIIFGYLTLGARGKPGAVYNQGSERTNSVLSYLLLSLEMVQLKPVSLRPISGDGQIQNPSSMETVRYCGLDMQQTAVDQMILDGSFSIGLENHGLEIQTPKGVVRVEFCPELFRPSDVPMLLSCTSRIQELGYRTHHSLRNIIRDQVNYYLDRKNRAPSADWACYR